jgi:hypothetical protein
MVERETAGLEQAADAVQNAARLRRNVALNHLSRCGIDRNLPGNE